MTNFKFSKVVDEIQREIELVYLPGCIRWTDERFDGAWSKLLDQFERVLDSQDPERVKVFVSMYRTQVLGYIDAFKSYRSDKSALSFIDKLKADEAKGPVGK